MSDLAIYRASRVLKGTVEGAFVENNLPTLAVKLTSKVQAILLVKVNGFIADNVSMYSASKITCVVPKEVRHLPLNTLEIIITGYVPTSESFETPRAVTLGLGYSPSKSNELESELQRVTRSLLMSPGSDIWAKGRGSGLRNMHSKTLISSNKANLSQNIQVAIDRLNNFLNSSFSVGRSTKKWRATKVSLKSIKLVPTSTLPSTFKSTSGRELSTGSGDKVIFINLETTLSSPSGSKLKVSGGLTV